MRTKTMNEIRKEYRATGKLYIAVGDIIETLKSMDEQEIRKVGMYFGISWREFSKQAKFSKARLDFKVLGAIICGVLEIENHRLKGYNEENVDYGKLNSIDKMIYSYHYKNKLEVYRTACGCRYTQSQYAVDLTVGGTN